MQIKYLVRVRFKHKNQKETLIDQQEVLADELFGFLLSYFSRDYALIKEVYISEMVEGFVGVSVIEPIERTKPTVKKEHVLKILSEPGIRLTHSAIVMEWIKQNHLTGSDFRFVSGSVSSILGRLLKQKLVEYATERGPKGGRMFQLKKINEAA